MNLLITTAPGLESLVKRECERLKFTIRGVEDRAVRIETDIAGMIRANIWLRCANRVYIELGEGKATDFDALFDVVRAIKWKPLRPRDFPIQVDTVLVRSTLTSEPAVQRIVKKAIVESLVLKKWEILPEVDRLPDFRVLVRILADTALVLLDTSGPPLHKRGYRTETGDAPLKETLAAAMVYLSNWRYKDGLLDPCAGSGTIPIEAAMIARNIAPGLTRNFAFEYWDWIERELITVERTAARKKIFPSGGYTIHGSDENPTMIDIARANSLAAGVADDIVWSIEACPTYLAAPCLQGIQTLITNPPYGERLDDGDVEGIHRTLLELFGKNSPLSGGVITSQAEFIGSSKRARLDQRKMYNGSIECKYCFRKSTV